MVAKEATEKPSPSEHAQLDYERKLKDAWEEKAQELRPSAESQIAAREDRRGGRLALLASVESSAANREC
jgi:hypothetical protein